MNMDIRRFEDGDSEAIVELSMLAWAPVFRSFEMVLGSNIFLRIYPEWESAQRDSVLDYCTAAKNEAWVAVQEDGSLAGFVVYEANAQTLEGEVHMLAVHPDCQNRGIGTELNRFALEQLSKAGMKLAVVGTGGDPGHAPARRSYEKAGYIALPLVRYYKAL